jgi:hypothetical protein
MTSRAKLAFVPPSLPTLVAKSPGGDAWLREVKHDGYRVISVVEAARRGGRGAPRSASGRSSSTSTIAGPAGESRLQGLEGGLVSVR